MWISMSRGDATEIHASINDGTVLYDYMRSDYKLPYNGLPVPLSRIVPDILLCPRYNGD
jgi:hypothetical protein